jgi:chromate reductase, NAD(P)H dehydrogenase (quinone)
MATPVRILAFSGSARLESLNRKFLNFAVQAVKDLGCEVTLADLNEYVLPLYHGDLEDAGGLPENAVKLIALIASHQGLLIASPEYNSMITPLLKNTIDWCTRADDNPFEGKPAAVISASPGPLGGVRSLQMAQQLLLKLGCRVVPGQCFVPHAAKAFDAQGRLIDARAQEAVRSLMASLVKTVSRLSSWAARPGVSGPLPGR